VDLGTQSKSDQKWLWIFVPINAAIGGFSTLLPLYIIDIGGTVIDVGNIISAYSLTLIPSSILWGIAVDRKEKRKPFVTYSYLGITLLLVAGFFLTDIPSLLILYVCYAGISTASSPAVSILLMESSPKKELSMTFAKYSSLTLLGTALGTIPGAFWTNYLPLRAYFLLCAIFSGISVVLAARYLAEPEFPFERKAVALSQESFVTKLRTVTMIFITIPSLEDIKSFGKMMRSVFTRHLPLLYLSFFLFFMASNLFFTSYTPFLKSRQMDDSGVFIIFTTLYILQAAIYPITGRACGRFGEDHVAVLALWLRTGGILAALTTVLLMLHNSRLITASIVSIAVIGTSFAFFNTSSSVLLFRTLPHGKQGELLGIYSALTGIAAFVGAIMSGYLSYSLGYALTFVATVLLYVSCALVLRSAVREH
jgi:MFS family permease